MSGKNPYVSILFANRNDGYGGDQLERFHTFCIYYSYFDSLYPDIFEFVFCDWNPPLDRASLKDCIDWSSLKRRKFVTVTPEQHQDFTQNLSQRKIFDYVARNTCARHSTGSWLFVLNQDILATPDIMHFIGQKKLNSNYFYRADRIDFNFRDIGSQSISAYMAHVKLNVTFRHRRQRSRMDASATIDTTDTSWQDLGTKSIKKEKVSSDDKIIYGDYAAKLLKSDRWRNIHNFKLKKDIVEINNTEEAFYLRYQLHTNACGDFVIAPRSNFFAIRGCPETLDYYMHTDSYLVLNLFLSGLTQAIFTGPSGALHANHRKVDHYASEKWAWEDHVSLHNKICKTGQPYFLGTENWGMNNYQLKVETFGDSYEREFTL